MATVPSGTRDREFGRASLAPSLAAICRALRPLPEGIAALQRTSPSDVATISETLLLEAAASGRADCLYAFCRVNAEGIRGLVDQLVQRSASPLRIDALITEVIAQVTDGNRSAIPAEVRQLYRSIPGICECVVESTTDEVLGFVPTIGISLGGGCLARAIADRLEIPGRLTSTLRRVVDPATTTVLAAQALLGLSTTDRSLLLARESPSADPDGGTVSVAQMLSLEAADRRYHDEFDRIVRWLRRAMESDSALSESRGEELR